MRLTDLDPRWLVKDGRRAGVLFITPQDNRERKDGSGQPWRQVCTFEPMTFREQVAAVHAACTDLAGEHPFGKFQTARDGYAWSVAGGPEAAAFETLTITPSIDGSAAGLWHGFITNGEAR